MLVMEEITLYDHVPWGGAIPIYNQIIECGKVEEFDYLIEETFPNGLSKTELNDILWFSWEYVYDCIGIPRDEK